MTARELAKLSVHMIKDYSEYYHYFGEKEFKYRTYIFKNLNPLFNAAIPVDGLKIEFTEGAGYGIAASAFKDGAPCRGAKRLESELARREETVKLLSLGFGLPEVPR